MQAEVHVRRGTQRKGGDDGPKAPFRVTMILTKEVMRQVEAKK